MPPTLTEIVSRLGSDRGADYERAVRDAFNFLGFSATLTGGDQAESDVIAEALYADSPYFIVIECCAVDPGNQVGYDKLGQIRGNFPAYLDERRQRVFGTGFKVIVGKPEFSSNARTRSEPDVGLIESQDLAKTMEFHSKYCFSQDELRPLMSVVGELTEEHIRVITGPYQRRIAIYALICLSLLVGRSVEHDDRRPFTPIEQIVGQVIGYSEMLQIPDVRDYEVRDCIRDMSSPIQNIINSNGESIRLRSLPFGRIAENQNEFKAELLSSLNDYGKRLQTRL